MSPFEVVGYLENLSSIASPYGLVVVVQETGVRASGDDVRMTANMCRMGLGIFAVDLLQALK